jgi:L-gulonate 3-dehydrogenase
MAGPVACIGSGLIGRAWAIVFARAGHQVRLWDAKPHAAEAARAFAAEMLPELEDLGLLDVTADEALELISPVTTLEAALDGVLHVQESTFEEIASSARYSPGLMRSRDRRQCLRPRPPPSCRRRFQKI